MYFKNDYYKKVEKKKDEEEMTLEEKLESGLKSIDTLYNTVTYESPFTILTTENLELMARKLSRKADLSKVEKILKLARKILINDEDTLYKKGDLVVDKKNKEFGVVLGKKPDDMKEFGKVSKKTDTYLLLTISFECSTKFRIRYTRENYIQLIYREPTDTVSIRDIKKFCRKDCSKECSESCQFFKYKPKPIKNFAEDVFGKEDGE